MTSQPNTEEKVSPSSEQEGNQKASEQSNYKLWIGLGGIVVILLVLGGLRMGSLSGKATGNGPAMGCGGAVEPSATTDNTTQPEQRSHSPKQVLLKKEDEVLVKVEKEVPLPELLKKIAIQRKVDLANAPSLQPKQQQISAQRKDKDPLPLPELLKKLKEERAKNK